MSARFEIEKRKLANKIRQKERNALGGLGSWFLGAWSANSETNALNNNFQEGLKSSVYQVLENPEHLDKVVKAAGLFKASKMSSLGTVVLGSIIGGILASRLYLNKTDGKPVEAPVNELKEAAPTPVEAQEA